MRGFLLLAVVGCGRVGFEAGATTDGAIDAVDATIPGAGPWGPVRQVQGVNTGSSESDPSVTRDRRTMVLVRSISAGNGDIQIATRPSTTDVFTSSSLTVVNTTFDEASPEISADGRTLYFVSNRSGLYAVYRSSYTTFWSVPALVPELSDSSDVNDVAVSPDALTALVVHPLSSNKILQSTRASTADVWGPPVDVPSLAFTSDADAPTLTDGATLVLMHAGGTRDLYTLSLQPGSTYAPAVPISEINTAGRDAAPFVTGDAHYLYYDRAGDIYEASR